MFSNYFKTNLSTLYLLSNLTVIFVFLWQGRFKKLTNIEGFSKIIFEPEEVPEIDAFRKKYYISFT